jgi:hypothetical protein
VNEIFVYFLNTQEFFCDNSVAGERTASYLMSFIVIYWHYAIFIIINFMLYEPCKVFSFPYFRLLTSKTGEIRKCCI